MTSSMLTEVRRHCSTVPDFCIRTIIDEVSATFLNNVDDGGLIDIKAAHVLMAAQFLVQDGIFTPDIAYCFIPFLTREICGKDIGAVLGPVKLSDAVSKPIFVFVEDHMISIRQGLVLSGPTADDNIVRRSMSGIVPKDEKLDPLRTIAFNLSKAVLFCCANQPPSQGQAHGSPRSPGQA